MTQIHVLDDSTINKIAAGEVVERPASVVKELVENAMDAGATAIEIEIMGGGVSFIRVTDNGRGMTREDAQTAILRHATSKISSVSDLQTVATLGFRGEALPTIASVSRFSLLTRRASDDLGTRVDILGGKTPECREAVTEIHDFPPALFDRLRGLRFRFGLLLLFRRLQIVRELIVLRQSL